MIYNLFVRNKHRELVWYGVGTIANHTRNFYTASMYAFEIDFFITYIQLVFVDPRVIVQQSTMAHKRSNSSIDDHASQPTKIARTETILVATDPLLSARTRIVELENQILDLHAFIDANGLTRSKFLHAVPPDMA